MKLYRAFFEKKGEAAYISHLDLQRVMTRAMKRSGVPVWYTQGFNPHIYLTFALPLSLGQEGLCETMDFKCDQELESAPTAAAINRGLPAGIRILSVEEAVMKPADICLAEYEIQYTDEPKKAREAIQALADLPQVVVEKKNKKKEIVSMDITDYIEVRRLESSPDVTRLFLRLPAGNTLNVNPALVCDFLADRFGLAKHHEAITRIAAYTAQGEIFR